MATTISKLTGAVGDYFEDLLRIRASGGATGELSYYPSLANLLNAVGGMVSPKIFCVSGMAQQGAGHPDFGLYVTTQMQKGKPRQGQPPEGGMVDLSTTHPQAHRFRSRTQLVGDRADRLSLRPIQTIVVEHHPHRPLTQLGGISPIS